VVRVDVAERLAHGVEVAKAVLDRGFDVTPLPEFIPTLGDDHAQFRVDVSPRRLAHFAEKLRPRVGPNQRLVAMPGARVPAGRHRHDVRKDARRGRLPPNLFVSANHVGVRRPPGLPLGLGHAGFGIVVCGHCAKPGLFERGLIVVSFGHGEESAAARLTRHRRHRLDDSSSSFDAERIQNVLGHGDNQQVVAVDAEVIGLLKVLLDKHLCQPDHVAFVVAFVAVLVAPHQAELHPIAIAGPEKAFVQGPVVCVALSVFVMVVPVKCEETDPVFDRPRDVPVGHLGFTVAIESQDRDRKTALAERHPPHGAEVAGEVVAPDHKVARTGLRRRNGAGRRRLCRKTYQTDHGIDSEHFHTPLTGWPIPTAPIRYLGGPKPAVHTPQVAPAGPRNPPRRQIGDSPRGERVHGRRPEGLPRSQDRRRKMRLVRRIGIMLRFQA